MRTILDLIRDDMIEVGSITVRVSGLGVGVETEAEDFAEYIMAETGLLAEAEDSVYVKVSMEPA